MPGSFFVLGGGGTKTSLTKNVTYICLYLHKHKSHLELLLFKLSR